MLNKSRGDGLHDRRRPQPVLELAIAAISSIEGVLAVRYLPRPEAPAGGHAWLQCALISPAAAYRDAPASADTDHEVSDGSPFPAQSRRRRLGTLAAPFVVTGTARAQNYKAEYRVSTVVPTAFPWGKGAQIWIDLVRERTQGRINMKLYPGVSLINGDQTREFSAIRQGVIDMALGSTINWSPQVKELNLFSLPFLARDHAGLDALTQGAVGKQILQIVEKAGVVPLGWGETAFAVTN